MVLVVFLEEECKTHRTSLSSEWATSIFGSSLQPSTRVDFPIAHPTEEVELLFSDTLGNIFFFQEYGWHFGGVAFLLAALVLSKLDEAHVMFICAHTPLLAACLKMMFLERRTGTGCACVQAGPVRLVAQTRLVSWHGWHVAVRCFIGLTFSFLCQVVGPAVVTLASFILSYEPPT